MDPTGTSVHESDIALADVELTASEGRHRSAGTPDATTIRRVAALLRRPVVAGVVLFLVYLLASLATDPGGSLSSDVGSKVATVDAIAENPGLDPGVGYWAEDVDPDGTLHPLYQSRRVGDRWIAVSTLPILGPAVPLWLVGGYRGVVVLAMLGSVAAAFAARAIARRLGAGEGWAAYWLVGLASPIAIYALVFWEHSTGVALMAWGVVLLLDLMQGRRGWPAALGAGALFGVAATMRTEALLYGGIATAVVLLRMLWDQRASSGKLELAAVRRVVGFGAAALAGVAAPLLANEALERIWLGTSLRASRAVGAAGDSGFDATSRFEEGLKTLFGANRLSGATADALLGLLVVAPLVVGVVGLRKRRDRFIPTVLILTSWFLILALLYDGLQFVPGLFVASPLAAFGLVAMWASPERRTVGAIAVFTIPFVLLSGYLGGAEAQWGGRYMLLSGFLLLVVATLGLADLGHLGAGALIVTAAVITLFGFAWTVQRTHAVAAFGETLRDRPEPVVVSSLAFQMRETGAYYEDGRYLAVPRASDLPLLVDVLERHEVDEFAYVVFAAGEVETPPAIEGFEPTTADEAEFLPGADVRIVHYDSVGSG